MCMCMYVSYINMPCAVTQCTRDMRECHAWWDGAVAVGAVRCVVPHGISCQYRLRQGFDGGGELHVVGRADARNGVPPGGSRVAALAEPTTLVAARGDIVEGGGVLVDERVQEAER